MGAAGASPSSTSARCTVAPTMLLSLGPATLGGGAASAMARWIEACWIDACCCRSPAAGVARRATVVWWPLLLGLEPLALVLDPLALVLDPLGPEPWSVHDDGEAPPSGEASAMAGAAGPVGASSSCSC